MHDLSTEMGFILRGHCTANVNLFPFERACTRLRFERSNKQFGNGLLTVFKGGSTVNGSICSNCAAKNRYIRDCHVAFKESLELVGSILIIFV